MEESTPPQEARARGARRAGKAQGPVAAIPGTAKRLVPPTCADGFDAVIRVGFPPS